MVDEELIYEAQRILHNRCVWWEKACRELFIKGETEAGARSAARAGAYKSACDILLAAVRGDKEILKEFDYYEEDEENKSDWCDEDPDNGWEL